MSDPTLKETLMRIKAEGGIDAVAKALTSPLARMAQEFSSGTRVTSMPFAPFARMDSKGIGFMGTQYLTDHLTKFDWPLAPEISYRGLKHPKMADDNTVKEGMAIYGIKSISPSGINVDFEIPLSVRNGGFMEPSVMMVSGVPRIICQAEIDNLMKRCTFAEPMDVRGGIFTPPLEREVRQTLLSLRDELGEMPHVNRGLFYLADRKKAQSLVEEVQLALTGLGLSLAEDEVRNALGEMKEMQGYSQEDVFALAEAVASSYSGLLEMPGEMMPQASKKAQAVSSIEVDKVINLRQQGYELSTIAEELDMEFETVRNIWEDYQTEMMRAMRRKAQEEVSPQKFYYAGPNDQVMEVEPMGEGEGSISIDPDTKLPYYTEEGPRVPTPVMPGTDGPQYQSEPGAASEDPTALEPGDEFVG